MGYCFVPECNHTHAYMKVVHVKLLLLLLLLLSLLLFLMSDLQDHGSLRSSNFDTILHYKAVGLFHNNRVCKAGGIVVILSREARGPHRPVGRPSSLAEIRAILQSLSK